MYAHQTRINEQNVKIWKAIFTPDEIDSENDEIGSDETDSLSEMWAVMTRRGR